MAEIKYLESAAKLSGEMVRLFEDEKAGGFFLNGLDAETLIVRPKEIYDGAIPSGNSVAALNLARLARMTGDYSWQQKAERIFKNFSAVLSERPSGYCCAMSALDFTLGPGQEIIIASTERGAEFRTWTDVIHKNFIPRKIILARVGNEDSKTADGLVKLAPFVLEQRPVKNNVTAYICENQVCQLPVTDLKEFKKIFNNPLG